MVAMFMRFREIRSRADMCANSEQREPALCLSKDELQVKSPDEVYPETDKGLECIRLRYSRVLSAMNGSFLDR